MPTGDSVPYRVFMTRPATIVGSANGTSMMSSTSRLPGKVSRTRTKATSVPITALTAQTSSELAIVNRSADDAPGPVIESQNPLHPFSVDATTTAASGSSTSRLIQSTAAPSPTRDTGPNRTVEPASTARPRPPRPVTAAGAVVRSAVVTRRCPRSG